MKKKPRLLKARLHDKDVTVTINPASPHSFEVFKGKMIIDDPGYRPDLDEIRKIFEEELDTRRREAKARSEFLKDLNKLHKKRCKDKR